jgi:hypothetical protein
MNERKNIMWNLFTKYSKVNLKNHSFLKNKNKNRKKNKIAKKSRRKNRK